MGVKVELDGVYRKLDDKNLDRGRFTLGNQMLADMDQFVPRKDGDLRTSGHLSGDNKKIIYQMPYARKHFYAPGGWDYTTPGTGPRWDNKAKGLYMNDWKRAFMKGAGF